MDLDCVWFSYINIPSGSVCTYRIFVDNTQQFLTVLLLLKVEHFV